MSEDVRDNADASRYELVLDGRVAGVVTYRRHGEQADFLHTEIGDEYEGHGLGSRLIQGALDDARSRGWQVLPYCPFVTAFIDKHRDYVDLVPADERVRFGLDH
jgi:uncharacterized protein